jgi:CRP/FNR family cyclic AMP-dependent transcriptional regulator
MLSAERGIKKKFFRAGDFVFTEGDPGDMAYIVETGSIAISKKIEGEDVAIATMKGGELFSEMAILDGTKRMANARAAEDSVVITLPRDIFEKKIKSAEPFLRGLVQILIDNLRNVHRVYMHRPRSVSDFLRAVRFHNDGLGTYLEMLKDRDLAQSALKHVTDIENSLKALDATFANHQDRRDSAVTEADVTRRKPEA